MTVEKKTTAILDFICAALWLVSLIFDIVEGDFSVKFYFHLVTFILFIIGGFLCLKRKNDLKDKANTETSSESTN